MSTNKVYGDAPNEIPLVETETRWDYQDPRYTRGIPETFRIDQSKHSLFGASKVAADVMVQEYGRYFDMPTCCLRGGCLTGPAHSGVELHGFLSFLVKCNLEGRCYNVYGYKGKQVRDNIHAYDVARFIERFIHAPRFGEVYNLGGGRDNCARVVHPCRGSHRPQVAMDLRRRKSSGRPHLLLFRSIKNERALSRMGNNEEPR
jgi:CDP-paratose 2-epimerase